MYFIFYVDEAITSKLDIAFEQVGS